MFWYPCKTCHKVGGTMITITYITPKDTSSKAGVIISKNVRIRSTPVWPLWNMFHNDDGYLSIFRHYDTVPRMCPNFLDFFLCLYFSDHHNVSTGALELNVFLRGLCCLVLRFVCFFYKLLFVFTIRLLFIALSVCIRLMS